MYKIKELEKIVVQIRRDILRMVHANNSGHPGGSLGCAEFFTALYFEIMNHNSLNIVLEKIQNTHLPIPVKEKWYILFEFSSYEKVTAVPTIVEDAVVVVIPAALFPPLALPLSISA